MKIESLAAQVSNTESMKTVSGSGRQIPQGSALEQPGKQGQLPVSDNFRQDREKVSPEEILDKIKEISEDGLYSVRFEKNEELNELVVKLVERQTEEVIRQIPPEEILSVKATLREYAAGNFLSQMY